MTFMFLYTHKQGTLIACHLQHCPVNIDLAWGGGGGDNDVHVPLHTPARRPARLSSSALPHQHRPGLGWGVGGATMTFMFLYTHQQGALHACHLKHCPVNIDLAWGGGWGGATMTFMFLYTHPQGALHACHLQHCPINIDLAWGGGWGGRQ